MLSGFVMSAEAEEQEPQYIIQSKDQRTLDNVNASWVWVERFQGNDSAELTLNGGNVAGSEFNKYPGQHGDYPDNLLSSYLIGTSYPTCAPETYPNNKDLLNLEQAQVAVFVNKSCTTLIATNVNFTGEVAVNGYTGDSTPLITAQASTAACKMATAQCLAISAICMASTISRSIIAVIV